MFKHDKQLMRYVGCEEYGKRGEFPLAYFLIVKKWDLENTQDP